MCEVIAMCAPPRPPSSFASAEVLYAEPDYVREVLMWPNDPQSSVQVPPFLSFP